MDYQEWEKNVPADITGDVLWKLRAYRLALFVGDLAWSDVTKLAADPRTLALSDQLYRAIGSIGANIAEGYSRSSGKDRARFLEYSLGSAREARDWYHKGRHVLGEAVATHRVNLITQITRLLLTYIPDQRQVSLKEEPATYDALPMDLLTDVPM
jgi:four helix bundle protein